CGRTLRAALVSRLNRPGGNITGVSFISTELGAKQLGLLHEYDRERRALPCLSNPNGPALSRLSQTFAPRLRPLGSKLKSFPSALVATSIRSLRALRESQLMLSWPVPHRCSTTVAYNSLRWRLTAGCLRSIPGVRLP